MSSHRTRTISVLADRQYINALNLVAARKETTVADMARCALDAMYGKEIEKAASFFASDDTQNYQSNHEDITKEAHHANK